MSVHRFRSQVTSAIARYAITLSAAKSLTACLIRCIANEKELTCNRQQRVDRAVISGPIYMHSACRMTEDRLWEIVAVVQDEVIVEGDGADERLRQVLATMPRLDVIAFHRTFEAISTAGTQNIEGRAMTVFETERLLFRRLTLDDADDLAALYSDPEVMRFFEGTRTRQQAVNEIHECMVWYYRLGFYFWATLHKADNRFIGRCGLLPQVIDDQQEYEVAYMLALPYWNQGLGTEAARAIQAYGFRTYGFPRLISIIAPRNYASIRVAEKNRMRYVKDVPFEAVLDRLYAVEAPNVIGRAHLEQPG